ncbi:hypothetical protein Tco_1501354 [Tanacetum coccineum]
MIACVEKTEQNADFHQIIDFIAGCSINYSLLVDPDLIGPWLQQFWTTASLRVINDVPHIRAMVAGKKILISEETIRADLLFDDAHGVDCFPKQVIWDSLRDIGYEGNLAQLTFSKPLFSPQWKYLVHVLLHCLSPKSTSWEQFGTNIASALVGLATNQKFNFSLMIMNGMLGHISNGTPFIMYPSASIITNPSELTRHIYHNHDIFYDGDDNEELSPDEVKRIQQILERTSFDVITPKFPITDSLSMGDEILDISGNSRRGQINKVLVMRTPCPNPSWTKNLSKDLSDIESECNFDSLLEEFFGELAHIDLIPPGINEVDFDPEEEIRLWTSYEEIDLFLTPDDSMPPGIKNDDSEGDILFFEELLSNNFPSLLENKSFHFDVPSSPRPPAKPPDDDEIEPDTGAFSPISS